MGEKQGRRIVLASVRGVWSANRKPASRRSECKQRSLKPHVLQADFWPGVVESLFRGITSGLPVIHPE